MLTFSKLGRHGRYGNQIAQICGLISVATKNAQPFCFPEWKNYDALERFGTKEDINVQDYFVNPLPRIPEGMTFKEIGYSFGYHDINLSTGNWDITHHFQSPKYFDHCIDLLRYYMTMKDEGKSKEYTVIHFRGGDYSGSNASYHPRQTMEYYEKAMSLIPGPYLVFSDEIETAKQMFGNGVYYVEGGSYLTDFRLMKQCKNFILANSSFSWSAAILANQEGKQVCAPANWFGPAFGSGHKEMSKDIYSEGWFVI